MTSPEHSHHRRRQRLAAAIGVAGMAVLLAALLVPSMIPERAEEAEGEVVSSPTPVAVAEEASTAGAPAGSFEVRPAPVEPTYDDVQVVGVVQEFFGAIVAKRFPEDPRRGQQVMELLVALHSLASANRAETNGDDRLEEDRGGLSAPMPIAVNEHDQAFAMELYSLRTQAYNYRRVLLKTLDQAGEVLSSEQELTLLRTMDTVYRDEGSRRWFQTWSLVERRPAEQERVAGQDRVFLEVIENELGAEVAQLVSDALARHDSWPPIAAPLSDDPVRR